MQRQAAPKRQGRSSGRSWLAPVAPDIGANPPFSGSSRLLACPDGPEQKANRQRQRQSRVRPLLHGLVDRNGHVVADLADRLDCFPSLVLGVRDDTSDIRTCRHGSILSYAIVCCKTKCRRRSSAFGTCVRTYAARTARCRLRCERALARWRDHANDLASDVGLTAYTPRL